MNTTRNHAAVTVEHIEAMFLGSAYFPVRGLNGAVWATKNGVIKATVRLVAGAIVVEQVGEGSTAVNHAKRVAKMFSK